MANLTQVAESEPSPRATTPAPRLAAAASPRSRRGSFFPTATIFNAPPKNISSPGGGSDSNLNGRASAAGAFSKTPPLKILVASWNVGNAMPPKDPKLIHEWIPEGGGDFDVIVIGLQESSYREKTSSSSSNATAPMNGEQPATSGAEASEGGNSSPRKEGATPNATNCDSETDDCFENIVGGSPTRSSPGDDDEYDNDDIENGDDDQDEQQLGAALTEAREAARRASRSSSSRVRKFSTTSTRLDGDGDDQGNDGSESPTATTKTNVNSGEVIIKRSRTKKSIRKVSKLVRQVSSNLRESVADVLDYAFNKQLYMHLGEDYALIGKVELMEMRLFAYVHTRHAVSGIEKISVPTGLGSVLGNKVRTFSQFAIGCQTHNPRTYRATGRPCV